MLPALITISFAAWMVFSVGALKLVPCRIWCPSEVIDSQESACKMMRNDSGLGTADGFGPAGVGATALGSPETGLVTGANWVLISAEGVIGAGARAWVSEAETEARVGTVAVRLFFLLWRE